MRPLHSSESRTAIQLPPRDQGSNSPPASPPLFSIPTRYHIPPAPKYLIHSQSQTSQTTYATMDPKSIRIGSKASKNSHKGSGSKFYTNPQAKKPPADDNITDSLGSAAGGSKAAVLALV